MSENAAAHARFHLGKAWRLKGDQESALRAYRDALQIDPCLVSARIALADLLLEVGEAREALAQYDEALRRDPGDARLEFRRRHLHKVLSVRRSESGPERRQEPLPENPAGRIRMGNRKRFSSHRGGWELGLRALEAMHHPRGILLDSFVENNFAWRHWREGVREPRVLKKLMLEGGFDELATSEERGIIPYREPWVGFMHNPHAMPRWFHYQESPQSIFAKRVWRESLPSCLGLFCFSRYQAAWLRQATGRPVSVLTHPAEIPDLQFTMDRFLENRDRKIIQVGWWLRKLSSIYQLPLGPGNPVGYRKVRLVPRFFDDADRYLQSLMQREREEMAVSPAADYANHTAEMAHVSDGEYDRLLAENVAFVDLYDSGANNTVVECVARATPLLINPLPAVVEYLGDEYPLYFDDLAQAAARALDTGRLRAAHCYLKECPTRTTLPPECFRKSFEESEVYAALPRPE